MRLHTHDYRSADTGGIVDGAILMHREMARLLPQRSQVAWHDLTRGPASIRHAGPGDTVYAGSGPYAFLYHCWRERTGQTFRIVREVHTALWSGYWTQEELCAPLLQEHDVVLFPTEYTRRLYIRAFPSITEANSAVSYPMLDRLPRRPAAPVRAAREPLRIGYLGALSLAKNFDQVLSVFARCHRESGGRVSLVCAGKPNHPRWGAGPVREQLAQEGVPHDAIRLLGILDQSELHAFFSSIDVLLFPSTASRETLGRVVLEALAHGVPVLAADIGPAVELLPARNLVPTALDATTEFTMSRSEPLGRIDEEVLVDKLLRRDFAPAEVRARRPYEERTFLDALAGTAAHPQPRADSPAADHDRTVAERLRVLPRADVDLSWALRRADRLFIDYYQRRDGEVLAAIEALGEGTGGDRQELRRIVTQPERNLADYRAFPRLMDALVLPPLTYSLAPEPVGGPALTR
ncbi:glycosyltransferase [Sorangium sp. So ce1151]|uniref:glycosyltransferase n=1 Tax=Sorangium sp. So ce1151 TaxID=3133332 RepID=UPI003F5D9C76